MAVLGIRCNLKFELANSEWSETYYWYLLNGTPRQFEDDLLNLCVARRALLTNAATFCGASYVQLPMSDGLVVGQSTFGDYAKAFLVDGVKAGAGGGSAGAGYGQKYLTVLWSLRDATGAYRRKLYMRGVKAANWSFDTSAQIAPVISPTLIAEATPFGQLLSRTPFGLVEDSVGVWSIRASEKDQDTNPLIGIDDVHVVGVDDQTWEILLAEDPGWLPGEKIHVYNVGGEGTRGLNGDHTIQAITGSLVTLFKRKTDKCPIDYDLGGSARLRQYRLYGIDSAVIERYIVRDTGGDRLAGRGRQRNNPFNERQ